MTTRRDLLKLLGIGGVVFASGLPGTRGLFAKGRGAEDFFFLQLSDTHWGFKGPVNPEADVTLKEAVATVNASGIQPDFIVFTGDLTHTTDDDAERRRRMAEWKQLAGGLSVKTLRLLPGEHDAALDKGKAFEEAFGAMHYSFDHKGVHFAVLDNVSDPGAALGGPQLDWLANDLKPLRKEAPIVVFTHRPLFDLAPTWDWATRDGSKAIDVLTAYKHVTVFYGHIHQEHHHLTGHIAHHAARSLIFPLPPPLSVPKKAPVAWDPARPGAGLGWRQVEIAGTREAKITEWPVRRA